MNPKWLDLLQKLLPKCLKTSALLILIPFFLISLQYLFSEIYDFAENEPFRGDSIYNPYEDYPVQWLRSNFHAHSKAWGGLTHGRHKPEDVYKHYYQQGYDVIGLSNYQHISGPYPGEVYIPTYEHGINIKKHHHLVLNASKPSFADFFLFQSVHHKQRVIQKIKKKGGMVALAHPKIRNAFNQQDMYYLKGYDFIEILNHYKKTLALWDAALTAGHPPWILAGDDSHNIHHEREVFINWTMIGSMHKSRQDILQALRKGCHYGVINKITHCNTNFLDSCKVKGLEVEVHFRYPADRITFIGDHGMVKKTVIRQKAASYTFAPTDTYIRVEAATREATIYMNPLLRYDGGSLPSRDFIPPVNKLRTGLFKLQAFLASSLLLSFILLITGALRIQHHRLYLRLYRRKIHRKNFPFP